MLILIKDFFQHYLRNGALFSKLLNELEETEKYSTEEIKEYQNEKLQRTINIAFEHVPFYRNIFKERKLTPQDIRTIEDLQKLPVIDKQTVRKNFPDFKNKNFKGFVFKGYTTGTTGSPGVFLRDLNSINFERAAFWRQYRWAGKDFDSRRVTLRGNMICPAERKITPFWKFNYFTKELIMSSYHLSDKNMMFYVEEIKKYQPFDLNAYPSTAYLLANYCKRFGVDLDFSAVYTSSEMLWEYQKEEIETVFCCKILDWYGNAERVAAIGQCDHGHYHEFPDYSIIEYLPQEEGQHEIVGTTLHNVAMPLIRYRTGDAVLFNGNKQCSCGRTFTIINRILGRSDDFIVLPNGRTVGGTCNNVFKGLSFIKEAQIVQREPDHIEILYVTLQKSSSTHEEMILERLHKYIGSEGIRYVLNNVDQIQRDGRGKFKFIKNLTNNNASLSKSQ